MNQKEIEIKIDQLGRPTIEAIGYKGVGCTDATAALEKALNGSGTKDRKYKPEATQQVQTGIKGRS